MVAKFFLTAANMVAGALLLNEFSLFQHTFIVDHVAGVKIKSGEKIKIGDHDRTPPPVDDRHGAEAPPAAQATTTATKTIDDISSGAKTAPVTPRQFNNSNNR